MTQVSQTLVDRVTRSRARVKGSTPEMSFCQMQDAQLVAINGTSRAVGQGEMGQTIKVANTVLQCEDCLPIKDWLYVHAWEFFVNSAGLMQKLKVINVKVSRKIKAHINIVYCTWYWEISKIEGEKNKLNTFSFNPFWLLWKSMPLLSHYVVNCIWVSTEKKNYFPWDPSKAVMTEFQFFTEVQKLCLASV